ncbi:MAG: hypothetical protein ACYC4U_19200 [Pirellulaceae bacterium]
MVKVSVPCGRNISIGLVIALVLTSSPSSRAQETDAEKAFTSYDDLMVGGSWRTKLADGSQIEQQFHWILDNKFLESAEKGNSYSAETVIGIDPESGKMTIWRYATTGSVMKIALTREKDGAWIWQTENSPTPDGKISGKGRITKVGTDEVRIEWLEFLKNGEKQDVLPPATFTRLRQ